MTLPDERTRAVQYARTFLRALLDPKKTPKVPRDIRQWAGRVLRHFPGDFDLSMVSKEVPDIFGKPELKERE